MFYIDTSVIVAYYCSETLSEIVEQLIVKTKQPAISHLTEIELTSAILRKIKKLCALRVSVRENKHLPGP